MITHRLFSILHIILHIENLRVKTVVSGKEFSVCMSVSIGSDRIGNGSV